MVQPQLPEGVFFSRILLCRFTGRLHLVDTYRDIQRRIRLLPDFRVRPVICFIGAIDHRIKCRINLAAFQNILRLLMRFITDAVCIRAGSRDQEIQRLHPGITGTLRHYIKKLPIRLRMQFIKHNPVDIETML